VQAEVLFSPLDPGTNYSVTAFTCTTSYCHGSGVTKTSPVWTSTTALACVDGCHGGDPSRTGMPSGHRRRAPRQRRQGRPVLRRRVELQPDEQSPAPGPETAATAPGPGPAGRERGGDATPKPTASRVNLVAEN
jgi:predicted CxxxxCH...CXXCH cytochrome family protein